mgnify:CR=1 FL=1
MGWRGFRDVQATIQIDLTKPIEELWQGLDKDARWGVRKAKKEGLMINEAKQDEWYEFYNLYKDTCKRGGILPLPFEKIKESKLFVCKKDNKIIAGAAVKEKNEVIELFLNASLPEFLKLQPNNLLYWSIIEYGKQHGFKIFDLGGYQLKARGHMQGINRFKERWGGQLVMKEVKGSAAYILGRKLIRNLPAARWVWDRLKGRPVPVKDKKLKQRKIKERVEEEVRKIIIS